MESASSFPIRASYDFRFTPANGAPVVLRGRIVHTLRVSGGGSDVDRYVTGVEFTDRGDPDIGQAIGHLLTLLHS